MKIFAIIGVCFLTTSVITQPTNVIAKTLYAEPRSEGPEGIRHVATVIYNRGSGNYNKCTRVCLKPKQFSCWNNKTDIIVPKEVIYSKTSKWIDEQAWAFCRLVETEFQTNNFKPLGIWNHYAVNNCKVYWFKNLTNRKTFRRHTFGYL